MRWIILASCALFAAAEQQPADTIPRTFEVVSVHKNTSGTTQTAINFTQGGVTLLNLQLRAVIQFAYGISQPSRLSGVPDWANNERFDIVARGAITSLDDRRVKLQALLADRFKLTAHTEQRSTPIYTLVLARSDGKLGPSLKPSTIDCAEAGRGRCGPRSSGAGELNLTATKIGALAAILSITQGRAVIDGTTLTGTYDIQLTFAPDGPLGRGGDAPAVADARPSIFTALQEQLGLKLQAGNRPEDVLVIDRISHPDEN